MNFIKKWVMQDSPKKYTKYQLFFISVISSGFTIGMLDVGRYIQQLLYYQSPKDILITGIVFSVVFWILIIYFSKWIEEIDT